MMGTSGTTSCPPWREIATPSAGAFIVVKFAMFQLSQSSVSVCERRACDVVQSRSGAQPFPLNPLGQPTISRR